MNSKNILRIILASLHGALLFVVIAEGILILWPWFFALSIVRFSYLWTLLGSYPIEILIVGLVGLLFGALIGLPHRWWWSLVISVGFTFPIMLITGLRNSWDISDVVLIMFVLFVLGGLLRAITQIPGLIKSSRRIISITARIAALVAQIGFGLLITRLVATTDDSVPILSVYEFANTKGWQIQAVTFGGMNGNGDIDVKLQLADGNVHNCIYLKELGNNYAYGGSFFDISENVQDAISCPP